MRRSPESFLAASDAAPAVEEALPSAGPSCILRFDTRDAHSLGYRTSQARDDVEASSARIARLHEKHAEEPGNWPIDWFSPGYDDSTMAGRPAADFVRIHGR